MYRLIKRDDAIIVSYIAISVKKPIYKAFDKKSLHTTAFSDLSDSQLYFVDSSKCNYVTHFN